MENNIAAILNYIEFLQKTFSLNITIHSNGHALTNVIYQIPALNIHSTAYCVYVKSFPQMWDQCIKHQANIYDAILKNNGRPFFGSCYAGVGEFIVPILENGKVYGFVSVGKYRGQASKMLHTAEKYMLNKQALQCYFQACLQKETPSLALIETVIAPICAMLLLEVKRKPRQFYSKNENLVHSALMYIHRNFSSKISLCDTANFCNCSARTLSGQFKAKTGFSVCGYIEKLRMEKARELLLETSLSIMEVAFLCGYADSNYFSSKFSSYYGQPPSVFQRQNNAKQHE